MKKIVSLFLCICMIFTVITSVYASAPLSDELSQKLSLVKDRIEDTSVYDNFNANKRNRDNLITYNFEWYTDNDGKSKSLNVSVNEEDIITSYYKFEDKTVNKVKPSVNKNDSAILAKRAKELIYLLNPMLADRIEVEIPKFESLYNTEYEFMIKRVEKGTEVYGDSGYVTISPDGNSILSFHLNYTCGLEFRDNPEFISIDSASEFYTKSLGLKLIYDIEYMENRQRKAVLKYVCSENPDTYISAIDGSVYTYSNDMKLSGGGSSANTALKQESAMDSVSFSAAEKAEISKINNLTDITEMENNLRNNNFLDIDDGYILTNSSVNRDYYDETKYTYFMSFEDSKGERSCHVICDALTGDVLNYYRYVPSVGTSKADIITEYAKNAVLELAKNYLSDDSENTYRISKEEDGYVRYTRFVNGIEFPDDTITVRLSKTDGNIESYNLTYNNLDFDTPDNIADTETATEVLFGNVDYKVVYLSLRKGNYAVPVYRFEHINPQIDAKKGILINAGTEEEIENYNDIDGHFAEDEITTLRRFGVGFAGGEFKPDKEITQGEYLALLSSVFSNWNTPIVLKENYDYDDAYRFADRADMLRNITVEEDAVLTRITACILLVRAMGYDEPASFEDIYVASFDDVTTNKGYVAILNAMGVVNGDGNNLFYPQKTLTRAECAKIIHNYLSR